VALVNNIKHTEVCTLNRKIKNKKIESDRFPHLIKIWQAANTIIVSYRRTQKRKRKSNSITQIFFWVLIPLNWENQIPLACIYHRLSFFHIFLGIHFLYIRWFCRLKRGNLDTILLLNSLIFYFLIYF
jgi:hypothetical protein